MKPINTVLLVIFYLIKCTIITGQDSSKPLYQETVPNSKVTDTFLYLHIDRSYYLTGESVLFKAYILDDVNNASRPVIDTLYVVLLDQDGIEVASGIFPVKTNQVSGNIELPDFLTEGNYMLIAATNLTNNLTPEKMFSRIIEIRKSIDTDFFTDLSLKDTLYKSGSLLIVRIAFSDKDNKPVPVTFTYQLTGISGEILSGKSKPNNEGVASLTLQLPEFDNKEILKLSVASSYKGKKITTGIVIPTQYNISSIKIQPGMTSSTTELKYLKIQLKTDKLQYEQKEKVQLDIYVTDDKGSPVMTNLSIAASNLISRQLPFENNDILTYTNLNSNQLATSSNLEKFVSGMKEPISETEKNKSLNNKSVKSIFNLQIRKFFAKNLLLITQPPGRQYIVQEKNNLKKLERNIEPVNNTNQQGYSSDRNIFDILMQVKPYRLINGKIIFGIGSLNSFNNQDGALIIVDGIKMGTDASILNNIPVPDIARITASTNVLDIQRYSAMNSIGIIEIFMKKGAEFIKNEKNSSKSKSNTIFWGPDIITDNTGKASISFFNNNNATAVIISVNGIAGTGMFGGSAIQFSVK